MPASVVHDGHMTTKETAIQCSMHGDTSNIYVYPLDLSSVNLPSVVKVWHHAPDHAVASETRLTPQEAIAYGRALICAAREAELADAFARLNALRS
jgi:hypothetical protein